MKDLSYGASYVNDEKLKKVIQKRNGEIVSFDKDKIKNAISKANAKMIHRNDKLTIQELDDIVSFIVQVYEKASRTSTVSVEFIQDEIERELVRRNKYPLSKEYMTYRAHRALARKKNTTDEIILQLVKNENKELMEENSNKNTMLASTQRDYIAGEVSRDISTRLLLPERIVKAHKEGILHFHDLDYFVQPIFNCCLINIKDMLDNGTVMNGKKIDSPKTFQVACTVTTQIIAAIASNQYGGQSVNIKHLGKYLRKSKEKYERELSRLFNMDDSKEKQKFDEIVDIRLHDELQAGVQTIQYQINTLMTTNGQAPFVTLFLHLDPDDEYLEETAMIIQEILVQRIQGIKNESNVYVTPAFPKLIYVLDEHNNLSGGKYDYITETAISCSIKRMYPDYISAKKMRENYEGNVFSCMGCAIGSSVIDYKIGETRYVESFERAWKRLSVIYKIYLQPNGKDQYIDTPGVSIWDTKERAYVKQYRIIRNTQSDWYRIKFNNGRTVTVTDNHPFETEGNGVVLAKDLTSDGMNAIRMDISRECLRKECKFDDVFWLYGMMLCDSSYEGAAIISLGPDEMDLINKAKHIMEDQLHYETTLVYRDRGFKGKYYDLKMKKSSDICWEFKNIFGGGKKLNRQIPNFVFNSATYEQKMSFLAGMIDADGYLNSTSSNVNNIQIGSTNRELAFQQFMLAQDLGYNAKIYLNHYKGKDSAKIRYYVQFQADKRLIKLLVSEKKRARFITDVEDNPHKLIETNCVMLEKEYFEQEMYSYDVTTESEHFSFDGIYSHNCRSFLSIWKDENGNPKFEGRFNQGVVSLNLPQIALLSEKSEKTFWRLLDERLELCFEALLCRHKALEGTLSDISPIHWQYGGIARLNKGETIDKLLHDGYSTISLGYIGIYETTKIMKGVSHTDPIGTEFALRVMNKLRETTDRWKKETGLGFGLYGTPAESLCYRFARIDKEKFGDIPDITDKGYYTNSYHVDVREHIDAFEKLKFESQFQTISSGGAISYIEVPNMSQNKEAMRTVVKFIYDNIQYAEFNTKSDYCHKCGFDGEILLDDKNEWYCPQCGNKDKNFLTVTRRTCGYLGANFWNVGKTKEIKQRVLHL